jgi:hypothetical protein
LRTGLAGLGSLGLADLLRLEAQAAPGASASSPKSIVALWLWGGPSHLETFDLKPDAPLEYRGEFRPIATNVPGIRICEHLPRLARLADRYTIIRTLNHDSPGHVNSTHSITTGHPGDLVEMPPYHPKYPDMYAVANKVLGERRPGVPPFVGIPHIRYQGAGHLGGGLDPLIIKGDPNEAAFRVPNLTVDASARPRFAQRLSLLQSFDNLRRDIDQSGLAESLDKYGQKAASILTSDNVRQAFEIQREDPRIRDRYGRNVVGQRMLLARRLVEAGVRLVTIDFPYVPGQKAGSWDDHASVWHIFNEMKIRLPVLDQVASAFIHDLYDRGLDRDVLFIVMGEMSHTPRLSNYNGQPGRDHWSRAISLLMAGGGMRMGQVIGETNSKGEEPRQRPVSPGELLATWYRYLGVPLDLHFNDFSGRPTPILSEGRPMEELV